MFSSKLSTKDLFTTNPGQFLGNRLDYSESAFSSSQSNSQGLNSQIEFSQIVPSNSQESTQPSKHDSQHNESPGRKYYQRYLSRPPLFARDNASRNQPVPTARSYQQQLQINKAKTKENDERDLLDSIVLTVQKCSHEVSNAVEAVKENIQQGLQANDENISQHLQKIEEQLSEHCGGILRKLEEREQDVEKMKLLEKEIASKDSVIKSLKEQLEKLEKQENQKLMEQLKEVYHDHQDKNREQLHQMHQEQLEKIESQSTVHKNQQVQLDRQCNQQEELKLKQQQELRELEERVIHEFEAAIENQNKSQEKMNEYYLHKLEDLHTSNEVSIQKFLNQKLQQDKKIQLETVQRQMTELQKKQKYELQDMIQQQIVERGEKQRLRYQEEIHKLHSMEREDLERKLHQRYAQQECLKMQYEQKCQEMYQNHQNEIDQLRQQVLVLQGDLKDEAVRSNSGLSNTYGFMNTHLQLATNFHFDKGQPKNDILYNNTKQFLPRTLASPSNASGWTSKELFSKSYQSPIAAIKPIQSQETVPNRDSYIAPTTQLKAAYAKQNIEEHEALALYGRNCGEDNSLEVQKSSNSKGGKKRKRGRKFSSYPKKKKNSVKKFLDLQHEDNGYNAERNELPGLEIPVEIRVKRSRSCKSNKTTPLETNLDDKACKSTSRTRPTLRANNNEYLKLTQSIVCAGKGSQTDTSTSFLTSKQLGEDYINMENISDKLSIFDFEEDPEQSMYSNKPTVKSGRNKSGSNSIHSTLQGTSSYPSTQTKACSTSAQKKVSIEQSVPDCGKLEVTQHERDQPRLNFRRSSSCSNLQNSVKSGLILKRHQSFNGNQDSSEDELSLFDEQESRGSCSQDSSPSLSIKDIFLQQMNCNIKPPVRNFPSWNQQEPS